MKRCDVDINKEFNIQRETYILPHHYMEKDNSQQHHQEEQEEEQEEIEVYYSQVTSDEMFDKE